MYDACDCMWKRNDVLSFGPSPSPPNLLQTDAIPFKLNKDVHVRQGYVCGSNISYVFMRTYSIINVYIMYTPIGVLYARGSKGR